MLHDAICLAILLRYKLRAKLQDVSSLVINKSRNIIVVATTITRSKIRFLHRDRLRQRWNAFFNSLSIATSRAIIVS